MGLKDTIGKILDYKHLINPLATTFSSGREPGDAPRFGGWSLFKDPKTNMAAWNAIYNILPLFGIGFVINAIANRKAESEVEDKLDAGVIGKLQALRPRLISDPNLKDVTSYTSLPKKELEQLEAIKGELAKSASDEENADSWVVQQLKALVKDGFKNAIPIAAAIAAASSGIALSNKLNRDRIKKQLSDRRIELSNIQALLDHKMLADAGLIDENKPTGVISKTANGPIRTLLDAPMLAHILLSTGLGIGTYKLMTSQDDNKKKIKSLKKIQLGSNVLQDTPQLSVLDLPVKPEQILAIPGDKKKETVIAAVKDKLEEIAKGGEDIIDVSPIEDSGILQEIKKKDALFA